MSTGGINTSQDVTGGKLSKTNPILFMKHIQNNRVELKSMSCSSFFSLQADSKEEFKWLFSFKNKNKIWSSLLMSDAEKESVRKRFAPSVAWVAVPDRYHRYEVKFSFNLLPLLKCTKSQLFTCEMFRCVILTQHTHFLRQQHRKYRAKVTTATYNQM